MDEKMMSFEEWREGVTNRTHREDFDLARQGTIPASEAVRIPISWDSRPWATYVKIAYCSKDMAKTSDRCGDVIMTIPRPVPQWVPKVDEPIFYGNSCSVTLVMEGFTLDGLIKTKDFGFVPGNSIKPFNPKHIGKPWHQIPSGVEE